MTASSSLSSLFSIKISDMDTKEGRDHYGYFPDFPYRDDLGRYSIHKKKQRTILWKQFFSPRQFCEDIRREERTWKVMFWLGITLAFVALVVSFIKELDEEKTTEDTSLYLSILELVLAIISVLISLSKHAIRHNTIVKLQKNLKTNKPKLDDQDGVSNRRKIYVMISIVWVFSIIVILGGFLIMHFKDEDTHEYLAYTKYTTVITLFLVIVLDGIINDAICDAYSLAQVDQCKLLISQLKLELKTCLLKEGSAKRINELEKFIKSYELFSVHSVDHFVKTSQEQNSGLTELSQSNHESNSKEKFIQTNVEREKISSKNDLNEFGMDEFDEDTSSPNKDGSDVEDVIQDSETESQAEFVMIYLEKNVNEDDENALTML